MQARADAAAAQLASLRAALRLPAGDGGSELGLDTLVADVEAYQARHQALAEEAAALRKECGSLRSDSDTLRCALH